MIYELCIFPEFVKKGRNSATIEVILINEGCSAYKPEIYGNEITIIRTIGSASSYKIKNSRGIFDKFNLLRCNNIIQ